MRFDGVVGAVLSETTWVEAETMFEYDEKFPAASVALTLKRYAIPAERPVAAYEVEGEVPVWLKLEQLVPWQLSTMYWVTPTASVDGLHVNEICDDDTGVAVRLDGAEGGVVSTGCVVPIPARAGCG